MLKTKDCNKELDIIEKTMVRSNIVAELLKAIVKSQVLVVKLLRDIKMNQVKIMKDVYKIEFKEEQEQEEKKD